MSVLSDHEIRQLVEDTTANDQPLISPFDEHAVEGASYDMRLGSLMVVGGRPLTVEASIESHTLHPGDFAVLTTTERLCLPVDLIGHNGIMSPWARAGLVSLFSPQIDPGFVGVLEVPVFNAGDAPIELIPGRRIFTVEFVRMSAPASFAWVDRHGGPKNPPSDPLPPTALRPNLSDVEEMGAEVEALRSDVEKLRLEFVAEQGATSASLASAEADKLRRFEVLETRLSGMADLEQRESAREGVRMSARQVKWAIIGVIVAILIAIAGVYAGSHYGSSSDSPSKSSATTTSTTAP